MIRVNASQGRYMDLAFSAKYRESGYETVTPMNSSYVAGMAPAIQAPKTQPVDNETINNTVAYYKDELNNNPLQGGEQFNLAGYSYGSILQAQVALKLAASGQTIDNLILIGSPISDNSDLMKQLKDQKNIKNIIRYDIKGDELSNPKDQIAFLKAIQSEIRQGDKAHHLDVARPTAAADKLIQTVITWLKQQGVKN